MKNVPLYAPGDRWFYRTVRVLAKFSLAAAYRVEGEGAENLPASGAAIIASNHKSMLDPFFGGQVFRRPVKYFAKTELFQNAALRWAITELGAIEIKRGESDRAGLETALAALADGQALIIYPEGHRRRDQRVHEFLPGVGMLALRSGAPVVPLAIKGSEQVIDHGRPGLPHIRVKVGPAVDLDGLEGKKSVMYAQAAGRIHDAVAALYESL
ncbi:MAG TPA: lysophospholipid acyltransferase family protein [Thermoleophilia bacterium]|nr:lysophospholipid acyltransferase family protein [Thermoleophilia bacterium]